MAIKKQAAGAPKGNPSWTKKSLDVFFAELSAFCNVAAASRAAGFPDGSSAYDKKNRDPAFRARYDAAIEESYSRLELEMLERARFGENRPAPANAAEARLRAVPTALGLSLLRLHASRRKGAAQPPAPVHRPLKGAKLRAALEARLSEINRRLGGNG